MGTALNWEKANRNRPHVESWRSKPSTINQLDYIKGLAVQKNQRGLRLPKTKGGASDMIERLLELPDYAPQEPEREEIDMPSVSERDLLIAELVEEFTWLSPQSARAFVHLVIQVDRVGCYFFFNDLKDEGFKSQADTLEYLLAKFYEWIA